MFSQRDEERVILEYFGDKADGRFLDIGAADGKTFSNTHALALRGWSGVCVEPNPHMLSPLLDLYRDREDIAIIAAAIVPELLMNDLNAMHVTRDFVSTLDDDHMEKWRDSASVPFRDLMVFCMMPAHLSPMPRDMINIDVEGKNADLLLACPLEIWQPKLLCIEHDNQQKQITKHCEQFGLKPIHETEENLILAR